MLVRNNLLETNRRRIMTERIMTMRIILLALALVLALVLVRTPEPSPTTPTFSSLPSFNGILPI